MTEEKKPTIDEAYKAIFDKLQEKFKKDLDLNDGNFYEKSMKLCSDHHYAVTLWVEEKRKLEEMEEQHAKRRDQLIKQHQAKSADISASNRADAVKMAMMDPRYIDSRKELAWRKKITNYLENVCKIFSKRYYLMDTIKDIYAMDKANAPIVKKDKDATDQ